jgi:hypothetical protein
MKNSEADRTLRAGNQPGGREYLWAADIVPASGNIEGDVNFENG